MKHYRQSCYYEEPMEWKTLGIQPCDSCGKDFHADIDNQFKYANGAMVFYCDRCMRLGVHEKVREYEPYED